MDSEQAENSCQCSDMKREESKRKYEPQTPRKCSLLLLLIFNFVLVFIQLRFLPSSFNLNCFFFGIQFVKRS
jgi:hypothetical protein